MNEPMLRKHGEKAHVGKCVAIVLLIGCYDSQTVNASSTDLVVILVFARAVNASSTDLVVILVFARAARCPQQVGIPVSNIASTHPKGVDVAIWYILGP